MKHRIPLAAAFCSLATLTLHAQETASSEADLAKQLANPIASLVSVPIQSNYDFGVGPGEGTKWTSNIQPVIPFGISEDWKVISRTILPVIDVIDSRTNKLVYRNFAKGDVIKGASSGTRTARIDAAVAQALGPFFGGN